MLRNIPQNLSRHNNKLLYLLTVHRSAEWFRWFELGFVKLCWAFFFFFFIVGCGLARGLGWLIFAGDLKCLGCQLGITEPTPLCIILQQASPGMFPRQMQRCKRERGRGRRPFETWTQNWNTSSHPIGKRQSQGQFQRWRNRLHLWWRSCKVHFEINLPYCLIGICINADR